MMAPGLPPRRPTRPPFGVLAALASVARWLPLDVDVEPPTDADPRDDPSAFVCPFCGTPYDAPRRRCASCDGLPVVPREAPGVYDRVVGLCGPRCDPDTGEPAGRPR